MITAVLLLTTCSQQRLKCSIKYAIIIGFLIRRTGQCTVCQQIDKAAAITTATMKDKNRVDRSVRTCADNQLPGSTSHMIKTFRLAATNFLEDQFERLASKMEEEVANFPTVLQHNKVQWKYADIC